MPVSSDTVPSSSAQTLSWAVTLPLRECGGATRLKATAIGMSALAEVLLLTAPPRKMPQRSLLRCAPRWRNSSPAKSDTSVLLLKYMVSDPAFHRRSSRCDPKRGKLESTGNFILRTCCLLTIVSTPDLASSRQISRSRPARVELENAGEIVGVQI